MKKGVTVVIVVVVIVVLAWLVWPKGGGPETVKEVPEGLPGEMGDMEKEEFEKIPEEDLQRIREEMQQEAGE
jgi:hypothetical protein